MLFRHVQRQHAALAQQHHRRVERRGQRHACAAVECLRARAAHPARARRQVHGARRQAGIDDRRDEQRVAEHHVVTFVVAARIAGEIGEGRPQHGLVARRRQPQQVIEVGQQPVTLLDQRRNPRGDLRVHPRFVDGAVVVPRMDAEARQEDAELHPAQQQFGRRRGPGEAANVVTDVRHARQREPEAHLQVVAQGFPRRVVVARPRLHVALHAGAAGARHEERPLRRRMRALRFARRAHHQHRLQHLRFARRERLAEAVRDRIGRPDLVLVVVVPGRLDPVFEQRRRDLLAPPAIRVRLREVEIRADLVPELHPCGLAGCRADQQPAPGRVFECRMVAQQARLDVRAQADAVVAVMLHEALRVGKLVAVPVEYVALRADRRIARRQVERIAQDVVRAALFDELVHLLLRVRRVGVAHRRARIAESPFGRARGAPGEPREAPRGRERRAGRGDEVVVEIAMLGDEIAVRAVIVVEFAAHVERAVRQRVVEQPEPLAGSGRPRDVERDVLVQRVGMLRAVAHRVDVAHLEARAGAVEVARAFAEAEHLVAALAGDVVIRAIVPPAEVVRLRRTVGECDAPRAVRAAHRPRAMAALPAHRDADLRGLDAHGIVVFDERVGGQREAVEIEAVAPVERHVVKARRDRPRARVAGRRVGQHAHPHDVVLEHEDLDGRAHLGREQHTVRVLAGDAEHGRMKKRSHECDSW